MILKEIISLKKKNKNGFLRYEREIRRLLKLQSGYKGQYSLTPCARFTEETRASGKNSLDPFAPLRLKVNQATDDKATFL